MSEKQELHKKQRVIAGIYFWDALEHYVDYQDHYFNEYPENEKPFDKNRIRFSLFEAIIKHISEEQLSTSAIYETCLSYAKPKTKAIDFEGLYSCPVCSNREQASIGISTNRDHIEITKNNSIDMEALSEYENTPEEITTTITFVEDVFTKCSCYEEGLTDKEKESLIYENTALCIVLEEGLVEYLKSEARKEKPNRLKMQ